MSTPPGAEMWTIRAYVPAMPAGEVAADVYLERMLERCAHRRGVALLKLDVMAGNLGALRLYEKTGFTRRRVAMTKALG